MFISDTHLPQMLPPEAYYEQAWYDRELEKVLLPAWWAVALTDELPRDGDFITFDHVGGPVILRRSEGTIRGYLNVCPHRLAKLTGRPSGRCSTLRCEYHGWEYDDTGATRRIPDATNFRPLDKGQLGLDVLRVETVGKVVFLSFAPDAPPVRDWLGDDVARLEQNFDEGTATVWREDIDLRVNWKIVIENNLESYHVGAVHAATLGSFPIEPACDHRLAAGSSVFSAPGDSSWLGRRKQALAIGMGRPADGGYTHSHVHPTFMWVEVDHCPGFQSVLPTGPRSCRILFRTVIWQSRRRRPLVDAMTRLVGRRSLATWKRIIGEDLAVLPQVQAGVESPRHPGSGLISRREERIVHFQRWLLDRMGSDVVEPFTKPAGVNHQGVSA